MGEKGKNGFWLAAALGVGFITALTVSRKTTSKFDFNNRVILITGGSRGLGLVLARLLAERGAKLAICARNADELTVARRDLESRGAEVLDVVCDVRNQSEVNQMVETVCNHYGQIDVLINNAGVIQVGPLEVQTQKDFEDAMAVHFWGPFYTINAVLPQMRERGAGRIVNVSSIGGKLAVPHLAPYCASKFALVGLSSAMRVELSKENIFITTVCPGLMRTGSHVNAVFKGQNEKEFAWFSIGNALPVSSISAESAATQIIEACRSGQAEVILSPQAQLAAKANALFPELTAEISALVNQLLPSAGGIGENHALGKDSQSFVSPSFLTALADKESYQNNEVEPFKDLV
ncbi:MAG: SDR family NAD(P)-dependent oxidoreductase [Acidobacteriota bacterium]|nr:SDR family NAD(P)-dependent oxidoreductase [Acidobacteriota bacterium]